MQTRFRFPILVVLTALIVSSCGKSNNTGRYIPKDASFVVHLNGESVSSKLPFEEIKKSDMFRELYADSNMAAYMKSALDNPENTGIDSKNDIIFFVQQDSEGMYMAIEGTVKDAAKFKQ